MATYYSKVLKFDLGAPAYPNAEVLHRLMVNILPPMAIVLVPHDTFGMYLFLPSYLEIRLILNPLKADLCTVGFALTIAISVAIAARSKSDGAIRIKTTTGESVIHIRQLTTFTHSLVDI